MSEPKNDSQFASSFLDPLLARLFNSIYGIAIPTPPRTDLLPLFTYAPPIAAPGSAAGPIADLLRLNTGVSPTPEPSRKRLVCWLVTPPDFRMAGASQTMSAISCFELSTAYLRVPLSTTARRWSQHQRRPVPGDLPLRGVGSKAVASAATSIQAKQVVPKALAPPAPPTKECYRAATVRESVPFIL